ncbi:hypothetical protein ACGC1H_001375 [Rhizoctonia solani]
MLPNKYIFDFSLVDAESCNIPFGASDRQGQIGLADAGAGASRRPVHIRVTSPVSAESQVDDDVLRAKVAVDVAAVVYKCRKRCSPGGGVDGASAVPNLLRDSCRVAGPEPDFDIGRGTFHCVPSSAVGVERWTVRVGEGVLDTASGVAVDLPVAVGGGGCAVVGLVQVLTSRRATSHILEACASHPKSRHG